MKMLLYPLRPSPLLLILVTSFMIWLLFVDLIFLLLFLNVVPLTIMALAYCKYLFVILERTANGYPDSPVLSYEFIKPFGDFRPYQLVVLLAGVYTLSAWLWQRDLDYLAIILVAFYLGTLPALIGLLGLRNGFLPSLNPVTLMRFTYRAGAVYWALCGVLGLGFMLILLLYRSGPGLFAAIFATLYSLVLIFHWIGRVIYAKRQELDYRPDNSPERAAEQAAEMLLQKRKHCLERVYKERRRENVLAVLLTHIEAEQDKLAAHAWYHAQMMLWDHKKLAVRHGFFYVRALREAGKHIIADLIQQECQAVDPDVAVE